MKINLTVKNKLSLGFGVVIFLMIAISINTFISMSKVDVIEDRLLDLRIPTVLAGAHLENGINLSLAGLRGYIVLGKDPEKATAMRKARMAGWEEIDKSMSEMNRFSKSWNNSENVKKFKEMEVYVEEFRQAQEEVENIAHTDDEVPAVKTLSTQAAPLADKMLKIISAMIDEEATLDATPQRKKLLKLMADNRGSFAISLANIRAYLLSGDTTYQDKFNVQWSLKETRYKQISSMTSIMTSSQQSAWKNYSSLHTKFAKYPPIMFKQRGDVDWNLANHWLSTKAAPKAKAIMAILRDMRFDQHKLEAADKTLLKREAIDMEIAILIGTFIALVIAIILATLLSRSITVPLQYVVTRAKKIASGDLTGAELATKGHDELTELTLAINDMNTGLKDIIYQISGSATELSSASTLLQSSAHKTNQNMEGQRSETSQVASSMNDMSATVQEVAHNASLAASSASEADSAAVEGHRLVTQNVDSITHLAQSINDASLTINKLGEDTNSVDGILAVITSIAEQTNLLALNAAIEAARAGEHGRGFAVVADEVRTLAGRTQVSTEEIRTMLDKLKAGVSNAVTAMTEGHERAKSSVEQAKETSDSIDKITQAVTAINEMNTQIAAAAEEQSTVADEMNLSVVKISTEADSTLKNAQETGIAAQQVKGLSSAMLDTVSRFKVT